MTKLSQAVGCLAVDGLVMFAKGSGIGTVEITDSELVGGRRAHGGQSYFHPVRPGPEHDAWTPLVPIRLLL